MFCPSFLVRSALLVLLVAVASAAPPVWTDSAGRTFSGEVTAVLGGYATVATRDQSRLLRLDLMGDGELDRVAEFLLTQPERLPLWRESDSNVARALRENLEIWDGEKLAEFNPDERPEPDLYFVYFSAHWCGPCRRFTPQLIEAYQEMKSDPALRDRFELVFVSSDRDAREHLKYIRETGMPWPVLKYKRLGRAKAIERWAGSGIPCLVVLTRDSRVLFHSYNGEQYLGPDDPLKVARELLAQMPETSGSRRARHPLAVRQHVLASRDGTRAPQAYSVPFDMRPYQRAELKAFRAKLTLDEKGQVREVETEPRLKDILEDRFRREARAWLFLPRAVGGVAQPSVVELPIQF